MVTSLTKVNKDHLKNYMNANDLQQLLRDKIGRAD